MSANTMDMRRICSFWCSGTSLQYASAAFFDIGDTCIVRDIVRFLQTQTAGTISCRLYNDVCWCRFNIFFACGRWMTGKFSASLSIAMHEHLTSKWYDKQRVSDDVCLWINAFFDSHVHRLRNVVRLRARANLVRTILSWKFRATRNHRWIAHMFAWNVCPDDREISSTSPSGGFDAR